MQSMRGQRTLPNQLIRLMLIAEDRTFVSAPDKDKRAHLCWKCVDLIVDRSKVRRV